jgi:uncharacterized protein (DUF2252 family)
VRDLAKKGYELEGSILKVPKYESEITESIEKRLEIGKNLRESVSRESHGGWTPPPNRRDPIEILIESNAGRIEDLVPIRHGRMALSPFTFLRGSASVMASDLSNTPNTGHTVQICGDCHLSNFGLFATPERNLIFDVNDFDETIPGPWEWDLKRLAASVYVAYSISGMSAKDAYALTVKCAQAYRQAMRRGAGMSALDIWYLQFDIQVLLDAFQSGVVQKRVKSADAIARQRVSKYLFPKLTEVVDGKKRFLDEPPLLVHVKDQKIIDTMTKTLEQYREFMPHEKRVLLDRYTFQDLALKVVGVGSVGTRCAVILLSASENDNLILQIKEARKSVIEPFVEKSVYENNGQRVVVGQKIMQSASDVLLGWTKLRDRDYYVRQLKDMKVSAVIENQPYEMAEAYVTTCGWTLAKAHARSGDPAIIAGYLGKGSAMDFALADFAKDYCQQTIKDHQALLEAIESGRIEAKNDL